MAYLERMRKMQGTWKKFQTQHKNLVRKWDRMVGAMNQVKFGKSVKGHHRMALDINPFKLLQRINWVSNKRPEINIVIATHGNDGFDLQVIFSLENASWTWLSLLGESKRREIAASKAKRLKESDKNPKC